MRSAQPSSAIQMRRLSIAVHQAVPACVTDKGIPCEP